MVPQTMTAGPGPQRGRRRWFRIAAYGLAALAVVLAADELWHTLDRADEKRTLAGVGNFGEMTPYLYRGAQPTVEGFSALQSLGIDTVIRVSTEKGEDEERAAVEARGMHFVALPWSAEHTPTRDQVAAFFSIVDARPRRTVFIHCKAGSDRTGVMVALYRVAIDRWSVDNAVSEMKAFHYRYYLLPHLERFVEDFPANLATDPALQALTGGAD